MKRIFTFVYTFVILIYYEILFHTFTQGSFQLRFFIGLLFLIPASILIVFISSIGGIRFNSIVYNLIIVILGLYFSAQIAYFSVFGNFFSLTMLKMGTNLITNFADQTLIAIKSCVFQINLFLLPILISVFLTLKKIIFLPKLNSKKLFMQVCSIIALHLLCLLCIGVGNTGAYSLFDIYHSDDVSCDNSINTLGLLTSTRLEFLRLAVGNKIDLEQIDPTDINIGEYSNNEYNVTNIDFNEIYSKCTTDEERELCVELSNRAPTEKNKYTGLFKDFNLITICAESFSPYLINEEITPTLYKLANNGIVFNNFYGSFDSVTTNGEYAFCMGLFPDMSRSSSDNSFISSIGHYLPYTLANAFNSVSADTFAYHNFVGTYYSRNITHPNLGYKTFKTPDAGLDIAPTWPSSDYDMTVKSVDDYINSDKQFHAYYMTFSGHFQYDWENVMDARNRSLVEDLPYSKTVKAYIAGNLELEKAMTYLLDRLKESGLDNKTVIVITNDHYPYGLSEEEYNELAGKEVDTDFERYKNSFICYNSSIETPIIVDNYCSTVDVLPTLLNLFGFDYDSRLLAGKDILSNNSSLAILSNQSFITDDFRYNVPKDEIIYTNDKSVVSDEQIEQTKKYIKETFGISTKILNTDFYKYLRSGNNE